MWELLLFLWNREITRHGQWRHGLGKEAGADSPLVPAASSGEGGDLGHWGRALTLKIGLENGQPEVCSPAGDSWAGTETPFPPRGRGAFLVLLPVLEVPRGLTCREGLVGGQELSEERPERAAGGSGQTLRPTQESGINSAEMVISWEPHSQVDDVAAERAEDQSGVYQGLRGEPKDSAGPPPAGRVHCSFPQAKRALPSYLKLVLLVSSLPW